MADPPPSPDTDDQTRTGLDRGSSRGASRWQKVIAILGLVVVAWVGDRVYDVVSFDGPATGGPGLHGPGPGEAPTETPEPSEGGTSPGVPSSLPQEFFECVADQGFDIESEADIDSVPPQVLQACFGALHGGGGVP
jgi:hypothetical protein